MRPRRTARLAAVAAVAVVLASGAAPAWAHGEKVVSTPDDDARVDAPPRRVTLTLTEAPTPDAVLQVADGCGDDVVADVRVRGETVEASISGGSPGRWRARYEVISAIDGHPTDGRWDFTVRGARDCAAEGDDGAAEGDDGDDETPGHGPTLAGGGGPRDDGDGGGGVPVVAVIAGAVALVAIALVARRFGAR